MPIVRKQAAAAKIEAGSYRVVCTKTYDKIFEDDQFDNPEKIILVCEFLDLEADNGEPLALEALCNYKLSPQSKLWGWFEAFGIQPSEYEEIDTDELVGKEALATVIIKKADNGSEWSRIESFSPPLKQKSGTRASQRPTAASAECSHEDVAYSEDGMLMVCRKCGQKWTEEEFARTQQATLI